MSNKGMEKSIMKRKWRMFHCWILLLVKSVLSSKLMPFWFEILSDLQRIMNWALQMKFKV
jgi:hypothetical protein